MRKRPEYTIWLNMIQRCHNAKNTSYQGYGGRGIFVCKRWRESFENFYADMGERPSKQHSLDRSDNNLGYGPDNCRWALTTQQGRNKRNNIILTINGRQKTLAEWAQESGIKYATLLHRIKVGWPHEDAITLSPSYKPRECR